MKQVGRCTNPSFGTDPTFRRDQLQAIHTAKHFEKSLQSPSTSTHSQQVSTASTASAIGQLTCVITDIAKDSIIQVLQQDSPEKHRRSLTNPPFNNQCHSAAKHTNHIDLCADDYDDVEDIDLQATIPCSLGVTATGLVKDQMVAGNVPLKNQLCECFGEKPSTVLHHSGQTVSEY